MAENLPTINFIFLYRFELSFGVIRCDLIYHMHATKNSYNVIKLLGKNKSEKFPRVFIFVFALISNTELNCTIPCHFKAMIRVDTRIRS